MEFITCILNIFLVKIVPQRTLSFFQRHLFYILCFEALKFKAAQFLARVIQIVPRKEFLRLEKI